MVCEISHRLIRNVCVAGQLFAWGFHLFDSTALLDMELTAFWDVLSLLYYSLGDVSVCWSVPFRVIHRLLLIFARTFVTACSGLGTGLKSSSFGYDGVGNVTVRSTTSSL